MKWLTALAAAMLPVAALAQLLPGGPGLPAVPGVPSVGQVAERLDATVDRVAEVPQAVARLAQERLDRIDSLVRAHPGDIARDDHGDAARADEVIVQDADAATVNAATKAGFTLIEQSRIAGLDIGYARFRPPPGKSLAAAIKAIRKLASGKAVSADVLHFPAGGVAAGHGSSEAPAPERGAAPARIGMIDGAPSSAAGLNGTVTHAGFARGAGQPSNHGSAVASLMLGTARIRGAAPGSALWAADVYGDDPAGGNALAIARALGWLVEARVPVTVISLVGPSNPLLARAVSAAQARGMVIVAAVGNDGPAAPPAYPASYPGVIAVTAVDGHDRVLIEAGRALHLDYAAPGADMLAADARGNAMPVRGTSFAAPLVAALAARHYTTPDPSRVASLIQALNAAARADGRSPSSRIGRGLLCSACRTPLK
ncbi:S8 family serine peptidase [Sphingomonas sp. GlSt437]|uniref:S8 family serine peptidase n=1 Tax=Sphingomonas sp. GlSt437 TaxID=3389970 RepID=UPI003A8AD8A0